MFQFSSDVNKCEKFLNLLEADGGGDTPEDMAGAFNLALEQDWISQCKYAILIADAPCHGKQYHDHDDTYPKGDPAGRVVED